MGEIVHDITIATWSGGFRAVRAMNRTMFKARQCTNHPMVGAKEIRGETATIFLVNKNEQTIFHLSVDLSSDETTLRRGCRGDVGSIDEIYGFLLSLYPLLGLVPNTDDIVAMELNPIDPGPPSLQIEASVYLMLGVRPPYMRPLDEFAESMDLIRSPENLSEWMTP